LFNPVIINLYPVLLNVHVVWCSVEKLSTAYKIHECKETFVLTGMFSFKHFAVGQN